ncbi:MAG: JAB domain-containing protein [Clostridia bacterium]|nr:JAB domain-containing protein [Clostridia bacterium]
MNDADLRRERLYNAIEAVLARMYPQEEAEVRLAVIRAAYGSPLFFLEAGNALREKEVCDRLGSFYFSLIPELTRRAMRERFGARPRLHTLGRVSSYLKTLFIGAHVECFYAILLDARGYLIDTVLVRKGTTDSAPFYLKDVLSAVISRNASAVVLSHNHPGGTPHPSKEDIRCTLKAMNALMTMQVLLLDHVIIAQEQVVSLRAGGYVPARLWLLQDPASRLLREWDPQTETRT